jgi:hypothetical protein
VRTLLIAVSVALAASAVASADQGAPSRKPEPDKVVYLGGEASLEKLRTSNPNHYARAERIIAAANELCRPGPMDRYFARFEAKSIACDGMIFKTSNPPKREIRFQLDDTRYIALVTVTDVQPQLHPAR